jgi:formate dehydrogenase subunit gamma
MSSERYIQRHTKAGIFIHWFNAAAWFFLLITGLALIANPELQPIGSGFGNAVRAVFGGGQNLIMAHIWVAIIWMAVWAYFIFRYWSSHTWPFLAQIFTLKPRRDLEWMAKKNIQMTMGYKAMAKLTKPVRFLGVDEHLPEQGYYNAGQKVAAQVMVVGALVLAATGLLMLRAKYWLPLPTEDLAWVQWAITIHYIAAGVTFAILLVHIFMAAIAKEERPAFWSMFTGEVPVSYAKHHHKLWYDRVSRSLARHNPEETV